MRKFRSDYGVYVCSHVFSKDRLVKTVIRDPDGYWQFLCGETDDNECHLVAVGHLVDADSTLEEMADLEPNTGADKNSQNQWEYYELEE